MKKKFAFFTISIISIIVLISVGIGTTYSKFTTTSDTKLSLEFIAEPAYTYYFQMPPDWGGTTVYSYMWGVVDGVTVENEKFPGIKMECVDSQLQIYSYTLSTELAYKTYNTNPFQNIIFSNDKDSVTGDSTKKTIDLNVSGDINGKIFVPELYNNPNNSNEIRVISKGYEPCYVHVWGTGGGTTWPGNLVASNQTSNSYISDKTYYTLIDRSVYQNMIFNQGSGNYQTNDLLVPQFQDLTCDTKGLDKVEEWKRLYYFGSWHTYSTWAEEGYNTWYENDYQEFVASANAGY